MTPERLTQLLKQEAERIGFDLVGVCPAVTPAGIQRLQDWLDAGYAGEMQYLASRLEAYRHPSGVLKGARSIVMLGMHYRTVEPQTPVAGEGRIARYAWGSADYHDVIHARLRRLRSFLVGHAPEAAARGVVDTAPLLEREFASLAGLGWIGKNTMLINRHAGSWFFLAALLTDQVLVYDQPATVDHCGTCRACLDACPTGAFPEPRVLDATRCISYLTIELRDPVPLQIRPDVGDWMFGCDICQEVCPWNRFAPRSDEDQFAPLADANPVQLAALFAMTDEDFRKRFRRTPLWRSKRRGILRNAAIAIGNQRDAASLSALLRGLDDREPLVRAACAWALGQFEATAAQQALRNRLAVETDPAVTSEIRTALPGD
jgi:epoxyqueuosine reductase